MVSACRGLHRWQRLVLLALLPLMTACASTTVRSSGQRPESTPPVLMQDGHVDVSCGGTNGWAPSAMKAGLPGVLTQAQVEEAFTELLANAKYRDELKLSFLEAGPTATQWRVLRVDGDTYTLGLGRWTVAGPQKGASLFEIRGRPGSWAWIGGGDCRLAPVLATGKEWVHVTALGGGLDRQSDAPHVGVTEQGCSGGRDPRPYLDTPIVHTTSTTVTVYWTATPPTGNWSCVGSAPTNVPLQLPSRLGNRALLDGSTFPPTPVTRTRSTAARKS